MRPTLARLPWPSLFALLTLLVTALVSPGAATAAPPEGEGELRLTAPAIVADGSTFTLEIEIAATPAAGYLGFQERLQWGAGLVPDLASLQVLSPHCSLPLGPVNMAPNDILLGCALVPPLPPAPFFTTGPVHRLTFTCHDPGGTILLTTGDNLQSIFVGASLQEIPVQLVNAVNVSCPAADSDSDGCPDPDEIALGLDPQNPRDWSDFDHSGAIDAADIALIVQAFGLADAGRDRTGDGMVSVGDIVRVVVQFGLVC